MEAAWSAHGLGPVAVNEDGLLGGWMASSRVSSSLNRLLEVGFAILERSVANMPFGP